MSKNLAILGSSRDQGKTATALAELTRGYEVEIVNLNNFDLSPFDYDHRNQSDDFLALAEKVVEADTLLLATPVYWYAMSAQMKVWFDRMSDLITIAKPLGRALAGKPSGFLATGTGAELPPGFENPFRLTFEYFSMKDCGGLYLPTGEFEEPTEVRKKKIDKFAAKLWTK